MFPRSRSLDRLTSPTDEERQRAGGRRCSHRFSPRRLLESSCKTKYKRLRYLASWNAASARASSRNLGPIISRATSPGLERESLFSFLCPVPCNCVHKEMKAPPGRGQVPSFLISCDRRRECRRQVSSPFINPNTQLAFGKD